jgi:hypothetical protein
VAKNGVSPYRLGIVRPRGAVAYGGVKGIGGQQPPNMVNLPPELYPPESSTPIFLSDEVGLVGANTSARPAGLQFTIPSNMVGVIDSIELLVDGLLITTVIQYQALVSGSPVQGFNALTILGRNGAQSVSKSMGPFLRLLIPLGGTFQMQFLDVDGGAVTMGAQARGWFWPAVRQ